MLLASALVIAAVSAPLFGRLHLVLADVALRQFFSLVCHEIPGRSFWIMNEPLALCVRCFGIYSGTVFGALLQLRAGVARKFLLLAALLNASDVGSETWGWHGSIPALRLLLGITLGVAAGALVCAQVGSQRAAVDFVTTTGSRDED